MKKSFVNVDVLKREAEKTAQISNFIAVFSCASAAKGYSRQMQKLRRLMSDYPDPEFGQRVVKSTIAAIAIDGKLLTVKQAKEVK